MENTFEKISIKGTLGLRGNPEFDNKPFFDLQVGAMVKKIGDGRENGCYRTDDFVSPFRYCGSIQIDDDEFYAFELPLEILDDKNIPVFILYGSTGSEVLRETKGNYRFYVPIFTLANGQIIK